MTRQDAVVSDFGVTSFSLLHTLSEVASPTLLPLKTPPTLPALRFSTRSSRAGLNVWPERSKMASGVPSFSSFVQIEAEAESSDSRKSRRADRDHEHALSHHGHGPAEGRRSREGRQSGREKDDRERGIHRHHRERSPHSPRSYHARERDVKVKAERSLRDRLRSHEQDLDKIVISDNNEGLNLPRDFPDGHQNHFPPRQGDIDPSTGTFDWKGDPLSAKYGSPEQSKVSRYSRTGNGRVLGLPPQLRINKESSRHSSGRGLEVTSGSGSSTASHSLLVEVRVNSGPGRRLRTDAASYSSEEQKKDFIPLEKQFSRPKGSLYQDPFEALETRVDESTSSSGESDDDLNSPYVAGSELREELVTLDNQTRSQPADISAWLKLAHLQAKVLEAEASWNSSSIAERSGAPMNNLFRLDRRGLADVQLSIIDKALQAHPKNRQSIRLRLGRLQHVVANGLWDLDEIRSEWHRLLATFDGKGTQSDQATAQEAVTVWTQYAVWSCSCNGQSILDIEAVLSTAFERLLGLSETSSGPIALKALVHLQILFCRILRGAGYPARAFAILQAQVEVTLAMPAEIKERSWSEQLSAFSGFWNSETLRLGEPGAPGWAKGGPSYLFSAPPADSVVRKESVPATSAPVLDSDPTSDSENAADEMLARQRRLASRRAQPARTTDLPVLSIGEGEVDPYAIVFASDIQSFLVPDLEGSQLQALILRHCGFSGVLVDGPLSATVAMDLMDHKWWPESLHNNTGTKTSSRCAAPFEIVAGEPMSQQRRSLLDNPELCPFRTALGRGILEMLWPSYKGIGIPLPTSGQADFAANFLDCVQSPHTRLDDLLPLTIKLKQLTEGSRAAALAAKEALSTREHDWRLWRIYAALQRNLAKYAAARKVYAACLASREIDPEHLPDAWLQAVELEIEASEPEAALTLLIQSVSFKFDRRDDSDATHPTLKSSAAELLRTRGTFERLLQDPTSQTAEVVLCYAWFEYLSQDIERRLSAAIVHVRDEIRRLGDRNEPQISQKVHDLYSGLCRIVRHHLDGTRPVYRPSELRELILEAVAAFPRDQDFLCLLAAHESRFKVEGVLRRTVDEVVLRPQEATFSDRDDDSSPIESSSSSSSSSSSLGLGSQPVSTGIWLTAIYLELHVNRDSFNAYRVRNLFERAIDAHGQSSLLRDPTETAKLWKTYLSFELRVALRSVRRNAEMDSAQRDVVDSSTHARNHRSGGRRQRQLRRALSKRAKGVFYRALTKVQWDRELHLCAFESPFRLAFSRDELLHVANVMANERGLRIYGKYTDLVPREDADEGRAASQDEEE